MFERRDGRTWAGPEKMVPHQGGEFRPISGRQQHQTNGPLRGGSALQTRSGSRAAAVKRLHAVRTNFAGQLPANGSAKKASNFSNARRLPASNVLCGIVCHPVRAPTQI